MTPLRVGDAVPNITLVAADGTPWLLRDNIGTRPLVLVLHRHLA